MCRDDTKPNYLASATWGPFSASTATAKRKKALWTILALSFGASKQPVTKQRLIQHQRSVSADNSPDPQHSWRLSTTPASLRAPFQADRVSQAQGTTCDVAGVCWVALCCFPFLHPFIHFPLSPGSFSLWGLCLHHKLIGLLSYQGGICIQTDGGTTQSQTSFS